MAAAAPALTLALEQELADIIKDYKFIEKTTLLVALTQELYPYVHIHVETAFKAFFRHPTDEKNYRTLVSSLLKHCTSKAYREDDWNKILYYQRTLAALIIEIHKAMMAEQADNALGLEKDPESYLQLNWADQWNNTFNLIMMTIESLEHRPNSLWKTQYWTMPCMVAYVKKASEMKREIARPSDPLATRVATGDLKRMGETTLLHADRGADRPAPPPGGPSFTFTPSHTHRAQPTPPPGGPSLAYPSHTHRAPAEYHTAATIPINRKKW